MIEYLYPTAMGRAGRDYVGRHLSQELVDERVAKVYARVLAAGRWPHHAALGAGPPTWRRRPRHVAPSIGARRARW